LLTVSQIRDYPFFADLNETELASLASCMSKRTFARNAYLYYPGNPGLSIYLVESGLVRLFFCDARGKEYILNLVGRRSVVGVPLLHEDQTRVAGAAALHTSVVLVLPWEDAFRFSKRSPQFMHNMYKEMDAALRKLFVYAQGLATASLNGRLATMLLHLSDYAESQGIANEVDLPLSQSEIASWLGASRGRLNRALSRLQQLGLIRVSGQKIYILDWPGLERMAEGL
jgi:CRP-like cAMP-binding protein